MKFSRQFGLVLVVLSFVLVLCGCRGGGVQSVPAGIGIEMKVRPGTLPADPQKREQVMKSLVLIMRSRVENFSHAVFPSIEQKGSDGIVLDLPGIRNQQKVAAFLTQNASLEFYI
jgi:hypothetical protein